MWVGGDGAGRAGGTGGQGGGRAGMTGGGGQGAERGARALGKHSTGELKWVG